ncbi:uncharacterized protein LOC143913427 [Arctopsyche grandis]|uniref:uncharacterized protein LOC143913427 n=1 Tax=Arctopsyche grandis TaxID=121162 RepID=UPI00406DA04E
MSEIVRIDSPLCFADNKSIVVADDNIPIENDYSEECKYEPHCYHCKYPCVKSGKINRYGWESECPQTKNESFVPTTELFQVDNQSIKTMEELNKLIKKINSLLDGNVTKRIEEEDIHKVVDDLNRIISNSTEYVPNEITKKLDEILFKVDLKNSTFYYPSKHIMVGVADTGEQNATICILVTNITDDMTNSNINFSINGKAKVNCTTEVTNDTDIMVDISNFNGKLVVAVMDKEKFFQPHGNQTIWKINSKIISISNKTNMKLFNDKQLIDIHLKSNENESVECVFWDSTLCKNGSWSSKGSEMFRDQIPGMVTCRWNHLTHFALLIQSKRNITGDEENICKNVDHLKLSVSTTEVSTMNQLNESKNSLLNGTVTKNFEEKDIHKAVDDLNYIISNSAENFPNEKTEKLDEMLINMHLNNSTFYYPSKHIMVGVADTGEQNATICILVTNITDDMTNSYINFSINRKGNCITIRHYTLVCD